MLGLALGEPDVVRGHRAAVAVPEVAGGPLDEGGGVEPWLSGPTYNIERQLTSSFTTG